MKILNDEQLAYLKNLESPKKKRKFMLDCLVKNLLGESGKFKMSDERRCYLSRILTDMRKQHDSKTTKISDLLSTQVNEHVKVFHSTTTAPRTFEGILNNERFQLPSDVIQRSVDLGLKGLREINEAYETAQRFKNGESAKSNYTTEEVDMAKNLMTEREKFAENVKKIDEKKWTDEDMRKCFINGMMAEPKHSLNATFDHYFEGLKKTKK
jgi:hypothetical protein